MMSACPNPLWPSYRAGARLTVDLDAIVSNYRYLQTLASGASCAAVVKADAYGLGIERVAPVLENAGATDFFVAHVDEGIRLRSVVSEQARITVLHGPRPGASADCVRYGLRPVLNSLEQIALWRDEGLRTGALPEAALQVDSGMSRFGLSDADLETLQTDKGLVDGLKIGLVMSHLACADTPDHPANQAQKDRMLQMSVRLPSAPLSLSASSGIFLGADYHLDVVRPGAALYGIAPNRTGPNPLLPVVRLQAHILQIREIFPGEGVGYGLTYRLIGCAGLRRWLSGMRMVFPGMALGRAVRGSRISVCRSWDGSRWIPDRGYFRCGGRKIRPRHDGGSDWAQTECR